MELIVIVNESVCTEQSLPKKMLIFLFDTDQAPPDQAQNGQTGDMCMDGQHNEEGMYVARPLFFYLFYVPYFCG